MSEDCLILQQTIQDLVVENADQEIYVTYTEMYIFLELKDLEQLHSSIVIEDEIEYEEITYNGYKIRAQG